MLSREEKSVTFYRAIMNAYKEEELQNPVKPLELGDDATEDFVALIYACFLMFKLMTEHDCDIIDFTHIVNKLIIQDLMDNQQPKEGE